MHKTAYVAGGLVMQTYCDLKTARILEVGSYDVNGTLRDFALGSTDYVGIDMEAGPGVDVVVKHGDAYPFEAGSFDLVMASSVFEHDPAFWLTFVEMCRVTKPGGCIYINAPSNGLYHRYPLDHWRFYPDAGRALANWAATQQQNVRLIESFVVDHEGEIFNDFVAIFQKEPIQENPPEVLVYERVPCSNVTVHGSDEIKKMREYPQDMIIIEDQRKKQALLQSEVDSNNDIIEQLSESLQSERQNLANITSKIETAEADYALEIEAVRRASSEQTTEFAINTARLENILIQRREEIEQAWSNLDAASKERDAALAELGTSKSLIGRLSEKLADANDWVLNLAGERKSLEQSVSRLKRDLTSSVNAQELIQTRLEIQMHEKANLRDQLTQMRTSFDEERNEFKKSIISLEELADEVKSRADELDKSAQVNSQKLSMVNASLEKVSSSLDDRFRELATVAVLLRQEEEASRTHAERTDWLRQVNAALMSVPRSWGLLSKHQRRKRFLNLLQNKGLFDADAYLARNTDVAERRMDPLLHYIQHGIGEGRSI